MQLTFVAFLTVIAAGQLPAAEAPKPLTGWQALFQQHARDWRITTSDSSQPLEVCERPLLFWSQPVRGGATGAVYLWTEASGRPGAIGTLFIWPHPSGSQGVAHELQSLSTGPIRGDWRGQARWNAAAAGVTWIAIDKAPPPEDSPARRRLQMRALANEFTAASYDRDDKLWKLRLLPQPLHRYEMAPGEAVVDGALFAFVQGTDAELFLLIEAHREAGEMRWRFACAPMTDYRLAVNRGERVVWQAGYRGVDTWNEPYVASTLEVRDSPEGAPKAD